MGLLSGISGFLGSPEGAGLGLAAIGAPTMLASTAIAGGTDIFNSYVGWKNYQLQRENLRWQQDVQNQTWAREDNAVQRRVRDLMASGMSPVLAAGDGAGAGQVVSTTAPQMNPLNLKSIENALAMITMENNIANSVSQRKLNDAQVAKTNVEADREAYDLNYFRKHKIPTTSSNKVKDVTTIVDQAEEIGNVLDNAVKKLNNKIEEKAGKTKDLIIKGHNKAYSDSDVNYSGY